jgi:gluconolactonase
LVGRYGLFKRKIKVNVHRSLYGFILFLAFGFTSSYTQTTKPLMTLEQEDPSFSNIVGPNAKAEIIDEGFSWGEGPVWVEQYKMLLFSDVKKTIIYKWTPEKGKEVYLTPAGYTGTYHAAVN